jgi:RHS repeat-associated protein
LHGEVVTTTYDVARGFPTTLVGASAYVTQTLVNVMGQVVTQTLGNGVATRYDYFANNFRLQRIVVGASLLDMQYVYDAVGNVKSISDGSQTQNFLYDALNRLTDAWTVGGTTGTYSETYRYNAIGNITNTSRLGSYTYGSKPHAVTKVGSDTFSYDANGNLYTRTFGIGKVTTYTFDIENRLSKVITGTQVVTYTYDGDGKRVLQQFSDGSKTAYASAIEIAITSTQRITKSYYQLSGKVVAMRVITSATSSTLYYMHSDHLGSASLTTSASGTVVATQRYGAWGNIRAMTGAMPTDIGYTGQRLDSTGLMFYNARYYDANIGRFISADSIVPNAGNPQALNRYSYVYNSPLNYVDPSGNDPLDQYWEDEFRKAHGRDPTDDDRYLRLMSLLFSGSGSGGTWTDKDWAKYGPIFEDAKSSGGQVKLPGHDPKGLSSLSSHLKTLSKYYTNDEQDQYIRAAAFLWSGVSYSGPFDVAVGDIVVRNIWNITLGDWLGRANLTPYPHLYEGNSGWNPSFIDAGDDNQSHHLILFLATGYFQGSGPSKWMNHRRDADNPPDLLVGDAAATYGWMLQQTRAGAFRSLPQWILSTFK